MSKTETINVNYSKLTLAELKKEIKILESENERMKKLSTRKGFYKYFFSKLPSYRSLEESFNVVNEEYHSLFGQYRYPSFEYFKQAKHSN